MTTIVANCKICMAVATPKKRLSRFSCLILLQYDAQLRHGIYTQPFKLFQNQSVQLTSFRATSRGLQRIRTVKINGLQKGLYGNDNTTTLPGRVAHDFSQRLQHKQCFGQQQCFGQTYWFQNKYCNPNSIDKVTHPNVLFVLTPFVSAMPICFSSHDTKNIQIPIFFFYCGKLDFPNPKKMRLTLFWNPTAGSRVPKFQRCGSVSVFGFGQKTMHHCQTHTLKPNSHHCWFFTQQI